LSEDGGLLSRGRMGELRESMKALKRALAVARKNPTAALAFFDCCRAT